MMQARLPLIRGILLALAACLPGLATADGPPAARPVLLDVDRLRQQLAPAGPAARRAAGPLAADLPTPDGERRFVLIETHLLPATDTAACRRLRTFVGRQADDPTHEVARTLRSQGLTADLTRGSESVRLRPALAGARLTCSMPAAPPAPLAYYRLRIENLDGTADHSPVVAVARPAGRASAFTAKLFPNPVRPGSPVAQAATLWLTDALGCTVRQQPLALPAGPTLLPLPEAAALRPGLYLLRVQPDAGTGARLRVLMK